ncbi:MAG: phosphopantothenoylcysteine decarboxylase/phosphopantothenate--cysteine ligase [Polaribacter sp.]
MNKKYKINPSPNDETKANILLGVTGGIAAYKSADLVRRLRDFNFEVRVVMTKSAEEFITPMTMQAVSGHSVYCDLFESESEAGMGHIELAKWADAVLIAPATANCIAKLAHGIADDLLTTLILATKAPLIIAPAMNQQMWANQSVKHNLSILTSRAIKVIEPASGKQACGDIGQGRMQEPLQIAQDISKLFIKQNNTSLKGKTVVITAGPTQESIDPVRFISNHSSGKMGYALAEAAVELGADVTLVSGPVALAINNMSVKLVKVKTAEEMLSSVKENLNHCDIFIGCAAIADYRPIDIASQKIKKNSEQMQLTLVRNPDILRWVSESRNSDNNIFVVGFAAESENLKEFAMGKLNDKKLDMICANDISLPNLGFDSDKNALLILDKKGKETLLPAKSKKEIAIKVLAEVVNNMLLTKSNERSVLNNNMENRSENRN